MTTCMVKDPPRIFSLESRSPLPKNIEALGAPPVAAKAAKAETRIIIGIHTPTPVRAKDPTSGIWPI